MKKVNFFILVILINFFWFQNLFANIVYIDLNKIMLNSEAGISINKQIKFIEKDIFDNFKKNENKLRDKENQIINQKNLLDENEYKKKVVLLKQEVEKYNIEKKKILSNLNNKKKLATEELIKNLNPILTSYMKNNLVDIILRKQDIIVAKNDLDITDQVIELLNNKLKKIDINN